MEPKISVIMPAFNTEKYITEAIESILNQTFQGFEFIIIDDGSTDNTSNIIDEFSRKDERIIYLQNEKNMGVSYTCNRGIAIAKGKYIALMDSDAKANSKRLEKESKYLDENEEIGAIGTNSNKTLDRDIKLMSLYSTPFLNSSVMIRKSLIDEHNLRYIEENEGAYDYEFFHRIKHYTIFHNLDEKLVDCRYHEAAERKEKRLELTLKIFNAALKEFVAEDFYIPLYNNFNTKNSINELKESFRVISEVPLMKLDDNCPFTRSELVQAVSEQKAFILENINIESV